MMGMPFTSYIWANEARRNTDAQWEESKESAEQKLVKKIEGKT